MNWKLLTSFHLYICSFLCFSFHFVHVCWQLKIYRYVLRLLTRGRSLTLWDCLLVGSLYHEFVVTLFKNMFFSFEEVCVRSVLKLLSTFQWVFDIHRSRHWKHMASWCFYIRIHMYICIIYIHMYTYLFIEHSGEHWREQIFFFLFVHHKHFGKAQHLVLWALWWHQLFSTR